MENKTKRIMLSKRINTGSGKLNGNSKRKIKINEISHKDEKDLLCLVYDSFSSANKENITPSSIKLCKQELKNKISSYKSQDKRKKIFDHNLITMNQLIEKLIVSKLVCHYCSERVKIFYEHIKDPQQWTLDRIYI